MKERTVSEGSFLTDFAEICRPVAQRDDRAAVGRPYRVAACQSTRAAQEGLRISRRAAKTIRSAGTGHCGSGDIAMQKVAMSFAPRLVTERFGHVAPVWRSDAKSVSAS